MARCVSPVSELLPLSSGLWVWPGAKGWDAVRWSNPEIAVEPGVALTILSSSSIFVG